MTSCPECGESHVYSHICEDCGCCDDCCDCDGDDALFDADELGLDPEEDQDATT